MVVGRAVARYAELPDLGGRAGGPGMFALKHPDEMIALLTGVGFTNISVEPVSTEIARKAAADIVGTDNVVAAEHPSMGSEDFSFYLERAPGCFVRLGARKTDWKPVPLHSPAFDIDERVLAIGTRFFDRVARIGSTWQEGISNAV